MNLGHVTEWHFHRLALCIFVEIHSALVCANSHYYLVGDEKAKDCCASEMFDAWSDRNGSARCQWTALHFNETMFVLMVFEWWMWDERLQIPLDKHATLWNATNLSWRSPDIYSLLHHPRVLLLPKLMFPSFPITTNVQDRIIKQSLFWGLGIPCNNDPTLGIVWSDCNKQA